MSHLTLEQRYTIEVLLTQGFKQKDIANYISRNKSVVSREIRRNRDERSGQYKQSLAQRKYEKRLFDKPKKIYFTDSIRIMVEEKLTQKLSPEQIVGMCKKADIACVSVERIYQHIWKDKKKKGNLHEHLRTGGKRYRKRGSSKDSRGIIKDRIPIEQRPPEVEQKQRFGDLEIDTIIGKNHKGAIVTINDRATGMLKMKKVAAKEAQAIKDASIELLKDWKPHLHTITADNGKEFAWHKVISKELNIDFYFANPYHSWERGANENLNGLIRQYIPKQTNFDNLTDEFILYVEEEINNRPRKRFNYESPKSMFNQKVAFVT
jgi:IS30 family transposase